MSFRKNFRGGGFADGSNEFHRRGFKPASNSLMGGNIGNSFMQQGGMQQAIGGLQQQQQQQQRGGRGRGIDGGGGFGQQQRQLQQQQQQRRYSSQDSWGYYGNAGASAMQIGSYFYGHTQQAGWQQRQQPQQQQQQQQQPPPPLQQQQPQPIGGGRRIGASLTGFPRMRPPHPGVVGGRVEKRPKVQPLLRPAVAAKLAAAAAKSKDHHQQQQQQHQQQQQQQQQQAASGRSKAEVVKDVHQAVQELCSGQAEADICSLDVLTRVRERVKDFQFSHVFALLRDLHEEARQFYSGDEFHDYTVLCDFYFNDVFASVQGSGPSQLSAQMDANRKFVQLLLANSLVIVKPVQRMWKGSSQSVPAVTGPLTPDAQPPALCQQSAQHGVKSNRKNFENRMRTISACLAKFQETGKILGTQRDTEILQAWDKSPQRAEQPPPTAADFDSADADASSQELRQLFVCHPPLPRTRQLPPLAVFRHTCRFNGILSVGAAPVGERGVQLYCGQQLLGEGEGDSPEEAKLAAANAFLRSASRLQPVVRTQLHCCSEAAVVAKADLVTKGRELYQTDPEKYDRLAAAALELRAPKGQAVMGEQFWSHLVARDPELRDFVKFAAAYAAEFQCQELECRRIGSDFSFAEMCAVYAVLLSADPPFRVEPVASDATSCRQELLAYRAVADQREIKRQLLRSGAFGRLRLRSRGLRPDAVLEAVAAE